MNRFVSALIFFILFFFASITFLFLGNLNTVSADHCGPCLEYIPEWCYDPGFDIWYECGHSCGADTCAPPGPPRICTTGETKDACANECGTCPAGTGVHDYFECVEGVAWEWTGSDCTAGCDVGCGGSCTPHEVDSCIGGPEYSGNYCCATSEKKANNVCNDRFRYWYNTDCNCVVAWTDIAAVKHDCSWNDYQCCPRPRTCNYNRSYTECDKCPVGYSRNVDEYTWSDGSGVCDWVVGACNILDPACGTPPPPPPTCGNGTVEAGEACDNGGSNGPCPATCSTSCTLNNCPQPPPTPTPTPGTAKYRCISGSCSRDDINGTTTDPSCGGICAPVAGCDPINVTVSPNPTNPGSSLTFRANSSYPYTSVTMNMGGGATETGSSCCAPNYTWTWFATGTLTPGTYNATFSGQKSGVGTCRASTSYILQNPPGNIQGIKVVMPGNQQIEPAASQEIRLDGGSPTTANPYSYINVSATNHTVSANPLAGSLGYTLCYNSTGCHGNVPTPGSSVTVNVPAGGYADLWWHYTPPPCTNTTPGTNQLTGCTFDGVDFNIQDGDAPSGPILTSPVPDSATAMDTINYWPVTGGPNSFVGNDTFSIRWRGNFTFKAGTYTFYVGTDDGAKLKIGGGEKINGWRDQSYPSGQYSSPAVIFTAPTTTEVVLENYENGGDSRVSLRWTYTPPIQPWIQTEGGDVHSNTGVNAPGGP